MKIRISGWRYENVRIGSGSGEIELGHPPKRWSLVQMPNGTGKTSTMTLMRAVLGEEKLTPAAVRRFRANDGVESGMFELGLLIEMDGATEPIEFRLKIELDYVAGKCLYSTLRPAQRGGGLDKGRVLPSDLQHLLKPEFIKLFVFDGELARDIRDLSKQAADSAIKTLYQLDDIGVLIQKVSDVVARRQDEADGTSGRTMHAITRYRRELAGHETRIGELQSELDAHLARQAEATAEAATLKTEIDEHIARNGDLDKRRKELDAQADEIRTDIRTQAAAALAAFRNPVTLSSITRTQLTTLSETLTRARLPKSVSSDFFTEVADDGWCICGREIGDKERLVLAERKEQYLAQDQITAIAAIKTRVSSTASDQSSFSSCSEKLQDSRDKMMVNEKDRARVIREAEERGDKDIAALRERADALKIELAELKSSVERIETGEIAKQTRLRVDAGSNLPLAKKARDEAQRLLNEVTNSFKLTQQKDVLLSHLRKIEASALEELRDTIKEATNDRLSRFVLMENLRVSKIDGALELTSNKVSQRDQVSEGQSLSVAYAFLTSLLSNAPFDLPFVVDSPALALDLDVRGEISRVIPDLFDQMIFFVISSEQASFAETFYDKPDAHFVTLALDGAGQVGRTYGLEAFRRASGTGGEQ